MGRPKKEKIEKQAEDVKEEKSEEKKELTTRQKAEEVLKKINAEFKKKGEKKNVINFAEDSNCSFY